MEKLVSQSIILVHGSFHTGECWYRLSPLLIQRGFTVHTPTLRGQRGNPRNPFLVSMGGYADEIIECAEAIGGRSILLGHSLAGFAISAAAERRPDLFKKLIYLTAAIPQFGKSTIRDTVPADQKNVKVKIRPSVTFPADLAKDFFYNGCAADIQAKAVSLLSPQPLRPLLGTVRATRARLGSVSKHMIACAHDHVVSLESQLARKNCLNFDTVQVLDSDHSPFYSQPEVLADVIGKIAFE